MIHDALLVLKALTATPVTATEAAVASETPDDTTGQACVDISKCPEKGISIEVIAAADTGTSTDKVHTITIYGCATVDGTYVELMTFPTLTYADTAAKRFVKRLGTQYKFINHDIVLTGTNGTMSRFYQIHVVPSEVDKEA